MQCKAFIRLPMAKMITNIKNIPLMFEKGTIPK